MQKACYLRTRTCQLQKTLTMLIEERYKDEDTGSDDVNSLPKLELSYSADVCFFLLKQKDNNQLEKKEIKNLPPNLKKNPKSYHVGHSVFSQ